MKRIALYTLAIVAITVSYGGCKKIKECPDEWIVNKMPTVGKPPKGGNQYFIYQGKRVEVAAVDTNWVKKHCKIQKSVVY